MDAKRKIDGLIKIVKKKESKGVVDQTTLCCHGAFGFGKVSCSLAVTDF
jgi:hypothetical protein